MTIHRSKNRLCSFLAVAMLVGVVVFVYSAQVTLAEGKIDYPKARKADVVDDYHGVKVPDPYRWLEDPNSPESREWINAQNDITFDYLLKAPHRKAILDRLTKLWNYEKYSTPFKKGGRYFFFHNTGLQNQNVLYTMKSLGDKPKVLIDPNTFSEDGTVALNRYTVGTSSVSPDGKYLVYGVSGAGSDWTTLYVRDIETGKNLPDTIEWVKFSGASWTADSKGFYYSRFGKPKSGMDFTGSNFFQRLCYHKIGSPQQDDEVVFVRTEEKEKNWSINGHVTDDGRFLIISARRGTERKNRIFYKDLSDPSSKIVGLLNEFESQQEFIDNDGKVFWLRSFNQAPRGRLIAIDIRYPEPENWMEIIPEGEDTLSEVDLVNNQFVCRYLKDAKDQVKVFDLRGNFVRDVDIPGIGTVRGFGGTRSDQETFYSFRSFTVPTTIYKYDMRSGKSALFRKPKVDFDPGNYESKQVFYSSKDGTRVPMFIVHKRGVKLDGTNPTFLYGYGGFNYAMAPYFSVSNLVWMEMGGVFAVANIRGGGEYGREWHEAGCKLNRQNVFDDFIAAAEWLVSNKYTSPEKLAISGASNGGLLAAACMLQRPDLFGASVPEVGVLDMLRFHKWTIGHAWVSDYGCSDNPEEFKAQYAYSPVHNCKKGTKYPATLITTGDHDDRVVPAHSFKFAAALQEAQGGDAPILIRIETRAGHGAGKPTSMIIEEETDRWAFLARVFKMQLDKQDKEMLPPDRSNKPVS